MPREILLRDLGSCIDCKTCVTACGERHGQPRMTMQGEVFGRYQTPAVCLHCDNPVCVKVCPYSAMKVKNGRVFVASNCQGCSQCMQACPHSAILMKAVGGELGFFETVWRRLTHPSQHQAPAGRILSDSERCVQCGVCSHNCPAGVDVRAFARQGLTVTDEKCVQCGLCVDVCPRRTLSQEQSLTNKLQANKCDLCRGFSQSACVQECPTGAMKRVSVAEAITLVPELGQKLGVNGTGQRLPLYDAPPVRK